MAWCKFFIIKMQSKTINPLDDPYDENVDYAYCQRGMTLRNRDEWLRCQSLERPDSPCWQDETQPEPGPGRRGRP